MVAFHATAIAASLGACGGPAPTPSEPTEDDTVSGNEVTTTPAYGAAPVPYPTTSTEAEDDAGVGPVVLYGAPAISTGAPAYGGPPHP